MINKLVTDNERHCLSTTKMGLFDWEMGGGGGGGKCGIRHLKTILWLRVLRFYYQQWCTQALIDCYYVTNKTD